MAKVTITITDLPNGKVKTVSDPSFETMCKIAKAEKLTSAHGLAIVALRNMYEASRQEGSQLIIPIPRPRSV